MAEGIVLQDNAGAIQICNPAAERILGLTAAQMVERDAFDPRWWAIHEDGTPFLGESHPVVVTLRTGQSISGAIMGVHQPNGTLHWISINSVPLIQPGESLPYGVVATFADITERHQAEQALHESEERLRYLVDNSLDGIVLGYRPGQVKSANPAACQLFGCDEATLIQTGIRPWIDRDDPRFKQYLEHREHNKTGRGEMTVIRPDGSRLPIEISAVDLPGDDPARPYWAIIRDMSETERYQQVLIEKEHLRTALEKEAELSWLKTRMMDRMIHEFRTPLAGIQAKTETLTHYLDRLTPDRREEKSRAIQRAIQRLTDMLDEISLVVRERPTPETLLREHVNLNRLCRSIAADLEATFGGAGRYRIEMPDVRTTNADPSALRLAVMHIMRNAALFSDEFRPVVVQASTEGGAVEIRVIDQGIGIPQNEQARLFEPFFRGTNIGEISGLGLGLSIAQDAIQAHHGTIRVESTEGQGTTMSIVLPNAAATEGTA